VSRQSITTADVLIDITFRFVTALGRFTACTTPDGAERPPPASRVLTR
jgi:hypothetical protein